MGACCSYEFHLKHFGFADCQSEQFYVSLWSKQLKWRIAFLSYKVAFFCYALSWIIADVSIIYQSDYWIFLTNWTEVTGCLYFLVSLISVIYGFVNKDSENTELKWFNILVWILFTTAINAALVTDLTFWILLSGSLSPRVLKHPLNIHEHLINYVLLVIDLFLNDIPLRLLHFIYPVGYAIVYVLFTVILWATGFRNAVYPVLNWETDPTSSAILSLVVIIIVAPILHVFHFGLYQLKMFIARHCLSRSMNESPIDDNVEMNESVNI